MGPFVVRVNQTVETYSNSNPSYSINKIMYTIIGGCFQGIKKSKTFIHFGNYSFDQISTQVKTKDILYSLH